MATASRRSIDVLPTFAAFSGAALPEKKIDGKSIISLIEGNSNAKSPHEACFYRTEAVRCGEWKLKRNELFNLKKVLDEYKMLYCDQLVNEERFDNYVNGSIGHGNHVTWSLSHRVRKTQKGPI